MFVYDGFGKVQIPASMGTPMPDQCQGTPLEVLGEIASRICYDSLGMGADGKRRGRSSAALHKHILEVVNLSVYEHCNFTVRFEGMGLWPVALAFLNRKGTFVRIEGEVVEATVNLRAIIEWDKYTQDVNRTPVAGRVVAGLRHWGHELAPRLVVGSGERIGELKVAGLTNDQAWISVYMKGSRGFTHEQVRHRFAMSQRSTRYVDEDQSEYEMHPVIRKYLEDCRDDRIEKLIGQSIEADRTTYTTLVDTLQDYLLCRGVDKATARKQARGAARGYLGNALSSEMIYSAPVSGWKHMMKMRLSPAADAEIRGVYVPVFNALRGSSYGGRFDETLVRAKDGMGYVLLE